MPENIQLYESQSCTQGRAPHPPWHTMAASSGLGTNVARMASRQVARNSGVRPSLHLTGQRKEGFPFLNHTKL